MHTARWGPGGGRRLDLPRKAAQYSGCVIEVQAEYGAAFNALSRRDDFIETEEREELFAALTAIPTESSLAPDQAATAGEWLARGLEEVRDW